MIAGLLNITLNGFWGSQTAMRSKHLKRKASTEPLVLSHLSGIKRALLEGEKRPAFLEFLRRTDDRRGLYALYDRTRRLYYAGKASDLPRRLDQHLSDRHAESWDEMTLFFLSDSADIAELEGLLVAAANPPGNKQRPHLGSDMRKELKRFLRKDAMEQIDQVVYPHKISPQKEENPDTLSGRITPKKLKAVRQTKLATVLGITPSRVNQLVKADPNNYTVLRRYIKEAGRRDSVLLLLQKAKMD
jgi:hypothetical protein